MKNNEDDIIGFEALYTSMLKCRRGVMWKDSVAHFVLNGIEECLRLEKQLKERSYKPRPTKKVYITHPKPREAISIAFRDRVYQRSLNDNKIYPEATKPFIYANMACQKGKGPDAARNLLDKYLRRARRLYGNDFYAAQFDIKGYYSNIDHAEAERQLERRLDSDTAARAKAILRTQYDGESGYNPGSQLVQIVGISYLSGLDHYIKERLRAKFYIRYQDDFIILHSDAGYLKRCVSEIAAYLGKIKLHLHPRKTRVYNIREGVEFLGFTHYITDSGKTIRIIGSQGAKAYRKKLRRMALLVRKGEMSAAKLEVCYEARKAHVRKGNTKKHIRRLDNYLNGLLKGVDNEHLRATNYQPGRRKKQ